VGVRERSAAVALAALPRLQLELTLSPGTRLQRQQDPLVHPSGPLNEPGAIGTRSIATPMNRTVADPICLGDRPGVAIA
jgi:hypothetical protein